MFKIFYSKKRKKSKLKKTELIFCSIDLEYNATLAIKFMEK